MALKTFPLITLYKGATTQVELDLTDFDLKGGSMMFTVEDEQDEIVFQEEYNTSEKHLVTFGDEFTASLLDEKYYYDIMWVFENNRYPQCLKSNIKVVDTVGGIRIIGGE